MCNYTKLSLRKQYAVTAFLGNLSSLHRISRGKKRKIQTTAYSWDLRQDSERLPSPINHRSWWKDTSCFSDQSFNSLKVYITTLNKHWTGIQTRFNSQLCCSGFLNAVDNFAPTVFLKSINTQYCSPVWA